MARPTATTALARHYIRDLVYGANDGIITTFAVVAGVTGGALSHTAILVVGAANPTVCDGGRQLSVDSGTRKRTSGGTPASRRNPCRPGIPRQRLFKSPAASAPEP